MLQIYVKVWRSLEETRKRATQTEIRCENLREEAYISCAFKVVIFLLQSTFKQLNGSSTIKLSDILYVRHTTKSIRSMKISLQPILGLCPHKRCNMRFINIFIHVYVSGWLLQWVNIFKLVDHGLTKRSHEFCSGSLGSWCSYLQIEGTLFHSAYHNKHFSLFIQCL